MNITIKPRFIVLLYKILKKYIINKKELYDELVLEKINENNLCSAVVNFILLFLIFFCLFYIIIIIISNSFNSSNSWFANFFTKDPSLGSYPEYNQISNILYINDWFSIDYGFIINNIFILTFFISIYLLYKKNYYSKIFENLNYCIILFIIIFITYIIIYFYNYTNITTLSKKINDSMNIVYNNINYDFINEAKLCDYFVNTTNNDIFENGKCNNIISKYNKKNIKKYISDTLLDIKNIRTMYDSEFKNTKQYNKIITALFTDSIINYFIKNNQEDELKNFFSIVNITNTNFLDNIYKFHINPFLYLKLSDLSFLNINYPYKDYIDSFQNNKHIYFLVIKDLNDIEYKLSNNIVNIYNICRLKMLSSSFINYIITLFIILFIIIYIIYNYNK